MPQHSQVSTDVSRRVLALELDMPPNAELRAALALLTSVNGWARAFRATDATTGEEFVVRLREAA